MDAVQPYPADGDAAQRPAGPPAAEHKGVVVLHTGVSLAVRTAGGEEGAAVAGGLGQLHARCILEQVQQVAAEVAQSAAAGGGAAHPPLQRDRGIGQAGAALAGLGQIDPSHPLAEERAQPLHHGGIAVDIGHHHPGVPPGQQPLRLPRRGGLEPQGFFQKHGLAPLHRALGIGQVELVGSAEHHCVHHVQQLLQAGGHPYPVKPVPDTQPPAALQGAAAYGGDGTAPRLGQKALHVPVGDGHRGARADDSNPNSHTSAPFFSFTPS